MSLENENNPVSGNLSQFPESSGQNSENPDPNLRIKKKGGRPKGSKNKGGRPRESGIALREKRKYEVSLAEAVRQGVHPDIILEYYKTVLRGQTPLLMSENGIDYIIPDPNPLTPAPTLEQRNAAMKALADRGYGLPAQSISIDAEYRKKIELQITGISSEQLMSASAHTLVGLAKLLELPVPKGDGDIIDAEIIENTPLLPVSNEE